MIYLPPSPSAMGMPTKFNRWRKMQFEAVMNAMDSPKRCIIQGAPVGFGKSLTYMTQAHLEACNAKRTVILTSTNALLKQVSDEFIDTGLAEVRGMGTYDCIEGRPSGVFGDWRREGFRAEHGIAMKCDEGPCLSGMWCPRRYGGCLYYDANSKAAHPMTKIVITNYAYWMSICKYGEGLGPVDILVMDEAHEAMDELNSFVGTSLRPGEMESLYPEAVLLVAGGTAAQWREWGGNWLGVIVPEIDSIKGHVKELQAERTKINFATLRRLRDLNRILNKVETVASVGDDWIIDYTKDRSGHIVKFDPVWPGLYAESLLFRGVRKLVMVSATIRPWTAQMLGIGMGDIDFKEYPSNFPKASRPIIFSPAQAMNRAAVAKYGTDAMSTHIDNIIARRLDRKGIIQTVSYERAHGIIRGSRYGHMMMTHDSRDTKEVIAEFKRINKPCILVSPVVDTGYDFPYTEAEYQILAKIPFPVTVDNIVKERVKLDPSYKDRATITKLMQMVGRVCRAEDDRGETIIIDADFDWWWKRYGRPLAAYWFTEAVRFEQMLSMPLPKLQRTA